MSQWATFSIVQTKGSGKVKLPVWPDKVAKIIHDAFLEELSKIFDLKNSEAVRADGGGFNIYAPNYFNFTDVVGPALKKISDSLHEIKSDAEFVCVGSLAHAKCFEAFFNADQIKLTAYFEVKYIDTDGTATNEVEMDRVETRVPLDETYYDRETGYFDPSFSLSEEEMLERSGLGGA